MTEVSNIILDLEILRQISENDKLAVYCKDGMKMLYVDTCSKLSGIKRWYNGYNREMGIDYIEKLIEKIETVDKFIIEGKHINTAELLYKTITNAIPGLQNLKNTYELDSIIVAKLTIIINKLNSEKDLLENLVTNSKILIEKEKNKDNIDQVESLKNY